MRTQSFADLMRTFTRSPLVLSSFVFLMTRRPPRSTLFPTRRSSDLACRNGPERLATWFTQRVTCGPPRTEEHTSELQSPDHLVCRRLPEKKKCADLARRPTRWRGRGTAG